MDRYEEPQSERLARSWRPGPALGAFSDRAAPALQRTPELQRFVELFDAFVELARERGDLAVRGSAYPPLGFAVRLQPGPTSPGGELCLWPAGGRLSTWSGEGDATGRGIGDRSLHLDLGTGFRWEALVFTDSERLAYTLLRWMEDRIAAEDGRAEGDGR